MLFLVGPNQTAQNADGHAQINKYRSPQIDPSKIANYGMITIPS